MSWRDTASRKNGDSRPVALNNGNRSFVVTNTGRVRSLGVKTGGAASTITLTQNGTNVLPQGNIAVGTAPAGVVPLNTFTRWDFGALVLMPGDTIAVTSTDTAALATLDLMMA